MNGPFMAFYRLRVAALVGPLGRCGPGPCGHPWALVGQALGGSPLPIVDRAHNAPGPLWARPLWVPWALVGRALVGPMGRRGPPGPL